MASTINASTSAGLVSTADTSGVLQLQTAGTAAVTVDASQNLGLGVTPSAWGSGLFKVFQIGGGGSNISAVAGTDEQIQVASNAYYDGSAYKYVISAHSSRYVQNNGSHSWDIAPSGTAGNAITFTQAMTLDASGNLGIGITSPTNRLTVISPAGGSATVSGNFRSFAFLAANQSGLPGFRLGYNESSSNAIISGVEQGGGIGGGIEFWSYNGSAFGERMRLDSSGNLGIGTSSPSASAILDAQSTTKGVRMPNMTTTQKNAISSPAAGLMVFDTTLAKLCVYSGSAWQTITSV